MRKFGAGSLLRPSDVAIYRPPHRGGPRGPLALLYICDMGNERIAIYSTNGDALGRCVYFLLAVTAPTGRYTCY